MPSPAPPRTVPPDDPDRHAPTRSATPSPTSRTRQVRGPDLGDDPQAAPREEPLLPHDRDESAHGTQQEPPTAVGRQAHEDLERGLVDTDRQPVMERAYRRQKEGGGGRPD